MLPEKFLERMQEMLGKEYQDFLASYDKERFQALRVNPLKNGLQGNIKAENLPFALEPVEWAENGYYYHKEDQPGKHLYHEAGLYYIQEPSAMAPVGLLAPIPGEKILDLCAAPGGKSTQIAAAMQGQGLLIANEIHPARAKILSENIERMGVCNACVTNETPEHLAEIFVSYFDRILVDAPCSGEGMFRKNDEACDQWSPENVELCATRQAGILDCAASMLRPGGKLVYSTCTFAMQENEESIAHFLDRHPDFALCEQKRLWPHKVNGEGHFCASLQKSGSVPDSFESVSVGGLQAGLTDKECKEWKAFAEENLLEEGRKRFAGRLLRFGENLYHMPPMLPNLKGLKVLRPGLHVGTLKKERFEPGHALALALSPNEVKHWENMELKNSKAAGFVNGETFPAEGEKGWYLICIDGYSIGWGKLAGGIMKNHYPKGLRKWIVR